MKTMREKMKNLWEEQKSKHETLSESNWYFRAANACEKVSDAILRNDQHISSKITKGIASKVGGIGASAGLFSIASLFGTASTGTAISTLSGASFASASLAWLGGSVAAGTVIVGAATIVGGLGAAVATGWVSKKYLLGEKQEKEQLAEVDKRVIDACLMLGSVFRQCANEKKIVQRNVAKRLYKDALLPLTEDLDEVYQNKKEWPFLARKRLGNSIKRFKEVTNWLKEKLNQKSNVTIGVVSAVILQLLSNRIQDFNEHEQLVIEALRRSNKTLENANLEEIATYVQEKDRAQLIGLQNNVKGIYHEILYKKRENSDGDEYIVELFEETNHPGADAILTNTLTGEVKELQLKATDNLEYINEHLEDYPDIQVLATDEVAKSVGNIESSGISNAEIENDVEVVHKKLKEYGDTDIFTTMTVAVMIALAKDVHMMLRGGTSTKVDKEKMLKDGVTAASIAGIGSLLAGW